MERDQAILLDLARAARLILEFREGMEKDAFLDDLKTQSSVLHQLIVMGEAVKRLSEGFRSQYSEIPWALIAGMRDNLIHGYDIVDLDEVWRTATSDVPDLLSWLVPRLPREG